MVVVGGWVGGGWQLSMYSHDLSYRDPCPPDQLNNFLAAPLAGSVIILPVLGFSSLSDLQSS